MKSGIWRAALVAVAAACGDAGIAWEGALGTSVPAEIVVETPVVRAVVDDATAGRFLIDTGAPYTILDTDAFAVPDGARAIELDAFGARFFDYEVVAYDALPFSMGDDPLAGVIGGDLLREFTLAIDYRDGRAWLFDDWDGAPPDDVELTASAALAIELRGGGRYVVPGDCGGDCGLIDKPATRVVVPVELEGERVWALVDTGASSIVLSDVLLGALGDGGRPRLEGVTVGTASGPREGYFTRIATVVLDDSVTLTSAPALVVPGWDLFEQISREVDREVHAIIGGTALRHFVVAFDYPRRELVLAEYADPYHIDPREYVRPGFELSRSGARWVVGKVYADTDAELLGVRVGEQVAELGGAAIAALDEGQIAEILAGYAVGERIPVGFERAAGLETVSVLMEDLLPPYEAL